MSRNISVGIDLGSSTTRVVVGEFLKGESTPKIIGAGESPTEGIRHGYVVNVEEAAASVRKAVALAEKTSGEKIKRAFVALSGNTLKSEVCTGVSIITMASGEVTALDANKALEECEENLNLNNKKIIQVVPLSYRLDGKEVEGRLEGLKGNKVEVKALFVTYSVLHLEDLLTVLAEAGVETIDVVPSGVAGSLVALSDRQKIAGGALVDIGAEKVSIFVFENGLLSSVHTFSLGGADITNDIALGFKIPLEEAEQLKLGEIGNLPAQTGNSKKKLDEIIEARLSDIFELIENHLKKIKRSGLLPAGIVFVGGGSSVSRLEELSKYILKLPASHGTTELFGNIKTKLRDPSWFITLGLVISGRGIDTYHQGSFRGLLKDLKNTIKSSIKQLMP